MDLRELLVFAHFILSAFTVGSTPDMNVTALKGQKVTLPCSIDSLKSNITPDDNNIQVVWMDKQDNVLYYNENRMIDDDRFTLLKLNRKWDLLINTVEARDEGTYRCVANTHPIKLKYYQLIVYVPPLIVKDLSSPDVEASEGTTVRLACNATGYPQPTVSWSIRRASEPKNSPNVKRLTKTGSVLRVQNVTRFLDKIYTCTASNGHGKSDHDIRIRVRFKPEVRTNQMKISQYKGRTARISCESKGYLLPRMYFAKDNFEIVDDLMNLQKYKYSWEYSTDGYRSRMILDIVNLEDDDFGYYKCVAINSLGRAEKFIEIRETKVRRPVATRQSTRIPTASKPAKDKATKKPPPPELLARDFGGKDATAAKSTDGGASSLRAVLTAPLLMMLYCLYII